MKGSVGFAWKCALPPFSHLWSANFKTKRVQNLSTLEYPASAYYVTLPRSRGTIQCQLNGVAKMRAIAMRARVSVGPGKWQTDDPWFKSKSWRRAFMSVSGGTFSVCSQKGPTAANQNLQILSTLGVIPCQLMGAGAV